MSEKENKIGQFVDYLNQGKQAEAGEVFKDALRAKVGDALDQKRQDMASTMFNGQALSHSDKKPEVATPGQFNRDGTITNADGTDGKTAADLSAETKPEVAEPSAEPVTPEVEAQPEAPVEAPAEAPATEQ